MNEKLEFHCGEKRKENKCFGKAYKSRFLHCGKLSVVQSYQILKTSLNPAPQRKLMQEQWNS